MNSRGLLAVTQAVRQRAQQRGYILAREIRQELLRAGEPEERWQEVVELLRESLVLHRGRYYPVTPTRPHLQTQQQRQQAVQQEIRALLDRQRQNSEASTPAAENRRQEERMPFQHHLQVRTEDGQELTLLSRDLSPNGIRLIGPRSLLGQKVRVELALVPEIPPRIVVVHILWTTTVGEGLFENGGRFVGIYKQPEGN